MKIKKISLVVFIVILLTQLMMTTALADNDNIIVLKIGNSNMLVNGRQIEIDKGNNTSPALVNGSTLVPIRAIIEAMGGMVDWDESEKKITISLNDKAVKLWLDKNTAQVNDLEVNIDVAPTLINGRTMLPLRFVSEKLGFSVNWEGTTQSISISSNGNFVGIVAGDKLSVADYKIFLSRAKQDYINYFEQNLSDNVIENIWDTKIDGRSASDLAKERGLRYSKEYKLYLAKAKEAGISLNNEDIKNVENYIESVISQQGGKENFEKTLKNLYNIELADYIEFQKKFNLTNKYISEAKKNMPVSDGELNYYYANNKDQLDKVTVKHILLSTQIEGKPLPEDKLLEVKKKAENILLKVKAGEDFANLAKQYSEDPGSKEIAGEYTFEKGKMVKEFEDWSFNAKAGDTGIVKTSYGYHIMKFEKRIGFEDVKAEIKQILVNQAFREQVIKWMEDPLFGEIKNLEIYNSISL